MKDVQQIYNVLESAFNRLIRFRKELVTALFIPVLVLVALGFVPDAPSSIRNFLLYGVIELLAYTVLAINTHRILLLGSGSVTKWGIAKPTKREFKFIFQFIILGLIFIPIGLLALIPEIGFWLMFFVSSYFIARFSLVFPAIATDNPWTFEMAWNATVGHQLLVIFVVGLLPVIIGGAEYLLSRVPYSDFLVIIVSTITTVYVVAALSISFEYIRDAQCKS
jgi:hypothetical protein